MKPSSFSTVTVDGAATQFWGLAPVDQTTEEYNARLNRTLNFRLGVFEDSTPAAIPKLRYFGIGIHGFYNTSAPSGIRPYHPKATNVWLHRPIPFRAVPIDNDLTPEERAKYRMRELRAIVTYDDDDQPETNYYFLYWLKLIDFSDEGKVVTDKITLNPETGVYIAERYIPTEGELASEPSPATENQTTQSADTIITKISGTGSISPDEVIESINLLEGGDMTLAKVSELGLFTGNDEVVSGGDGYGGTVEYTEAIYSHLIFHRCWTGNDLSTPGDDPLVVKLAMQSGNLVIRT
jgi:hypothetical protein